MEATPRFVYQVFNVTRSEVYVGVTSREPVSRCVGFPARPPSAVRHWNFEEDNIQTSSVERFEDEIDAVRFYSGVMKSLEGSAFKPVSCEFEIEPDRPNSP